MNDVRVLGLEDTSYQNIFAPYRSACKLPPLAPLASRAESLKVDFAGTWIFNEEATVLDNFGMGNLPTKLIIAQSDTAVITQKTFVLEYADDRIEIDTLFPGGKESKSEMRDAPRMTKAKWSLKGDTLIVESKIFFFRTGSNNPITLNEYWTVENEGTILCIKQDSHSPWGARKISMIFNKK
jgi:hypothetical protein